MFNHYFVEKFAQTRHEELLRVAQMEQLLHSDTAGKAKHWQKLSWQVGDWLINWGEKLKANQPPVLLEKCYESKMTRR